MPAPVPGIRNEPRQRWFNVGGLMERQIEESGWNKPVMPSELDGIEPAATAKWRWIWILFNQRLETERSRMTLQWQLKVTMRYAGTGKENTLMNEHLMNMPTPTDSGESATNIEIHGPPKDSIQNVQRSGWPAFPGISGSSGASIRLRLR